MENGIAVDIIANVSVAVAVLATLVVLTRNMRNDLNARMDDLNVRVGDLNVRVGDLNVRVGDLNVRVGDLKQEQVRTRQEMHALNDGLRQEMHALNDGLRQEMHALNDGLRQEMHALNKELRQEIGEVRRDLYVVGERTARIEGAALGLRRSFNGQADTPRAVPEAPAPTPAP